MSNATLHSESDAIDESDTTRKRLAVRVRRLFLICVRTGRAVGFWTAICVPFLYLPLLASGIETPRHALAFLCLLLVNLAALFAGRSYGRK